MRVAVVLALILSARVAAADDAANPLAGAANDQSTKPQSVPMDVQTDPKPGVRERFASLARTIKTGSSGEEVEKATTGLGKPSVTFHWCNRAGCVNHESEVGSNRMWVLWTEDDGRKVYRLGVMLCAESPGSWRAAMVTVNGLPKTKGAFGTSPTPENIYQDVNVRVPGCMAGR